MKPFFSITRHDGTKKMKQAVLYHSAVVVYLSVSINAHAGGSELQRKQHIVSISSSCSDMMRSVALAACMCASHTRRGFGCAHCLHHVTVKSSHVASACGITAWTVLTTTRLTPDGLSVCHWRPASERAQFNQPHEHLRHNCRSRLG